MMKTTSDIEEWPKLARGPFFNLISIALPILGIGFAAVFEAHGGGDFKWQIVVQALTLLMTFLAGNVLAIVAFFRSERFWGLTLLAFLLNAPLPLVIVLFMTGTIEQVGNFLLP